MINMTIMGIDRTGGDIVDNLPPFKRISQAINKLKRELNGRAEFIYAEKEQLIESLKTKKIDAMYSLGNTAGLDRILVRNGMIPKIRPMLVAELPKEKEGTFLFADVGAIVQKIPTQQGIDKTAHTLYNHTIMCVAYVTHVRKIYRPKVGILCNGTEDTKGEGVTKIVNDLFCDNSDVLDEIFTYKGYAEPDDAFFSDLDVLMTDGFTGNCCLKSMEAVAKMYGKEVSKKFKKIPIAGKYFLKMLNSKSDEKFAGALLLGFDGIIVKGHGKSNVEEIYFGIKKAIDSVTNNANDAIIKYSERYGISRRL